MNPKYEQEIKEFSNNFFGFKDKAIVLYGIGRLTATLVEGLKGFQIIGLMDKDPGNIGKFYFGLPVLSIKQAKEQADIIVINTAGAYWNIIYQRIKGSGIPIYYRNGELAREEQVLSEDNFYWDTSIESLMDKIDDAEIVSFDFYDTLFSRRVCNPKDALRLWEKRLKNQFIWLNIPWLELRNKALLAVEKNYSLGDLYDEVKKISGLPIELIEKAETLEIELESQLLVPRQPILECLKKAMRMHKQVYIITDMYLPEQFFEKALNRYDINLGKGHIIVSGTLKKNKLDGTMWKYFRKLMGNKKVLHIGDNQAADVEQAVRNGIDAYYIASAWDMLGLSNFGGLADKICTDYASMIMGGINTTLFSNPFALNKTKGIFQITTNYDMGYYVFGPVLLTFFRWLSEQVKKDNIRRLVFMSRDGYFLQEDFDKYIKFAGESINTCYIGISRQLAMTAAINDEIDLWEFIKMPYTGTLEEMLEDRFEILKKNVKDMKDLDNHLPEIIKKVNGIKKRYKKYIEKFQLTNRDAVVDIGYYGNNQRYLNKISGADMRGYYFNANVSDENINSSIQVMVPCFQKNGDSSGKESGILKYQMYLESFLTAPYGMVKDIKDDGTFLCKEKKQNQIKFSDKEEINKGVLGYIQDYITNFKDVDVKTDVEFIDEYYNTCFNGAFSFSDHVKRSFYNDNAMMNRIESNIFV